MTNTNYSFMPNYNTGANKKQERPATSNQYNYYLRLCKQRSINPKFQSDFTFDTMSETIKDLQSFYPASPKQIETIYLKIESLKKVLSTLNLTDEQKELFGSKPGVIYQMVYELLTTGQYDLEPLIPRLTGGREGTASAVIGGIIDIEKKLSSNQSVTEAQVELLVSMFFCPDIAFEDYNVLRRIEMEEGLWRKPSPQEFAEMIQANFNKEEASAFIDKYRGTFYDWKNTRAKLEQISYIKSLEARMGNDSHLSEVKQAATLDGSVIELDTPSSKREYIKGSAFTISTDDELLQYSMEQASAYIDQLKSELDRREVLSITGEEREIKRSNTSIQSVLDLEEEDLQDILYSLEAIAGYEDPELHVSINPEKIRDFCKDMLKKGDFTFWSLMEIAENNTRFQAILLNM